MKLPGAPAGRDRRPREGGLAEAPRLAANPGHGTAGAAPEADSGAGSAADSPGGAGAGADSGARSAADSPGPPGGRARSRRAGGRRWRWWPLVWGLLLAPPALLAGLLTAEVPYSFGPHEAVYSVTLDSEVTVDLGPLGAAVMPTPLPGPLGYLGARVAVGEIPADLTTAGMPQSLADLSAPALAQELAQYGQAYLGVEESVRRAAGLLVKDALVRAAIAWGSAMAATVLGLLAAGRSRRNQVGYWARRRRRLVAAATAGAMVLGLGGLWAGAALGRDPEPVEGDPLLAGTAFSKVRLTGRLGQIISDYGGVALQAYRDTDAFYTQAAASVEAAFAEQAAAAELRAAEPADRDPGAEGESADPGEPGEDGTAAGDDGAAGEGDGAGGDGIGQMGEYGLPVQPSGTPTPSPTPPWLAGAGPYGKLRPVVFFSDLHCNVGMARVVGAAARGAGAELVLDGGDTTMDGTAVERYCVDQLAEEIPAGVPWVVAAGNHDTEATRRQEQDAGAHVLDGSVADVAGLAILGDKDPTHTEVGQGTSLIGEETEADVARRLRDTACAARPRPDLLLVHDPDVAAAALEAGCVPAAVTGHMHTRSNPHVVGAGVLYTQSSTGRDTRNATMVGPLGAPAEVTVMLFDATGRWVAWQLLTVKPDATASLSAIKAVPEPPAPELGTAGGSASPVPAEVPTAAQDER